MKYGLTKDELGEKIITGFVALIPKTYSYLAGGSDKNKKAKATKMCVIKQKLKLEDSENYLKAFKFENETKHLEKNKPDGESFKGTS